MIAFFDLTSPNSIFTLTKDRDQSEHVMISTKKLRNNQQFTVINIDWDVDVKPSEICKIKLPILLPFKTST